MTISVLQERQTSVGSGNAASIQLAFASPVTPGSSIHVFCSGVDTATSFTCSDSVNGSYGAALDTIDQVGDTQRLAHFKFDNTASGTPTVTITPNVSVGFLAIWIREIGGTSGYDSAHKTALQTALGNGTDNVTTGTQAPNNQPGLLSALGACTSNFALPTAGTGFTAGANGWDFTVSNTTCTESKRYTALTAIAATFSNASGTQNFATLAAFFKESASAATAIGKPAVNGPGVSPDSRQMFRARLLSNIASPNITVGLTGQSGSFSAGSLVPSSAPAVAGQAATFAAGQIVAVLPTIGLSGYSGPGISPDYRQLFRARVLSSTVIASTDVSAALTGQSATFAPGTVLPASSVILSGQSTTFSAGTLGPAASISLTGQSAAFSAGAIAANSAVGLTGQSAAFSSGTIVPSTTVGLTGQRATFSAGTVSAGNDVTASLTGQATAFTAGIIAPSTSLALLGGSASFASGNLLPGAARGLTGTALISTAGAMSPAVDTALTGVSASFTAGVVGVVGDVTTSLTGAQATFTAGTFSVPQSAQPGALDSPLMSPGHYRRKKKRAKNEPVFDEPTVFIPPASIERTPSPETASAIATKIERVSLAQASAIDREIHDLLRQEAESDDEEAIQWILKALDS